MAGGKEDGRVGKPTGLSSPTEPQERLGPTGFDPSREAYALGLLGEEMGEAVQIIGKAGRFGIDTPGPDRAPYFGATAREMLEMECGDVLAAIEWATEAGLIRRNIVGDHARRKVAKLLDPNSRDNLGRRLAPCLRDSDGSPKGRDREDGLDGEAATARAGDGVGNTDGIEGIAPNPLEGQ